MGAASASTGCSGWATVGLAVLIWTMPAIAAGNFSSRPIKIVVPVAAGGAPDIVTRIVAGELSARLHQPVIIENRPGAGERIGAEYVANSDPDGYTLLAAPPGSLVISPLLFTNLPYNPKTFAPVTILTEGHLALIARPDIPFGDLRELVAFAKANPGKLTYASPGIGTPPHLTGEMLKLASGIETTHVPYKGLAPALNDLLAGHVDFMFDNLGNSLRYITEGRVKLFGVASDQRIPELPNVPTIAEMYPHVRATSWFAVVAPPKTPANIVDQLASALSESLHQPDVARKLHDLSFTPVGSSPTATATFLNAEAERWRSVVVSAGIQPE
jgi:tripartite-type tricarboxylate transporter receptor subunit TctC